MLVRNFQRILVWLIFSGVFWIAGSVAAPEHRIAFWLVALAIEYVSPALYFRVPGLGRARWLVELIRCRAGESADFEVEACDAKGRIALPSAVAYGSPQKEIGKRIAAV